MNVLSHHKSLVRLWAAVACDFESLLAKYLGSSGWRYAHFAKICKEMQITLIMHIVQGRGKTKDEHYYRVMGIILQQSKKLWFRGNTDRGRSETLEDKDLDLKRCLGGFYLLYTMYEKQPIKGRVKIALGKEDMHSMRKFMKEVEILPFSGEISFMLEVLFEEKAFHFCLYSEDYRFDGPSRLFLNYSRSEVVDLTGRMRDVQDSLAYSTIHREAEHHVTDMSLAKNGMVKDILKTFNSDVLACHLDYADGFTTLVEGVSSNSLGDALNVIDEVVDKPVVTLPALTATEAIEKRMVAETRLRMERARKKMLQALGREEHKAANPYVREGGIFGRKKEVDTEEKCKRRERGACNGNLWIYINGYDFNKTIDNNNEVKISTSPKPEPSGSQE